jgi:hypothetical protein
LLSLLTLVPRGHHHFWIRKIESHMAHQSTSPICVCMCVLLALELRAHTLSHSTSAFLWRVF